jgi:hypothetical protein
MTVRFADRRVLLEGACPVEDAETLLQAVTQGGTLIDLSQAGRLHTAVVQVLLAAKVEVVGEPVDLFIRQHVLPSLLTKDSPSGKRLDGL